MTTLKETAEKHSGRKYITDLDKVPLDATIHTKSFKKKGTDEEVTYSYMEINGSQYIVPSGALNAIKEMITAKPNTKFVKLTKQAGGNFTVIPFE